MVGYFWRLHMSRPSIPGGVVHRLPADLKTDLLLSPKPLARNEWICWVATPKKAETRTQHIRRATEDLSKASAGPAVGQAARTVKLTRSGMIGCLPGLLDVSGALSVVP
jgi:hypothetical protein